MISKNAAIVVIGILVLLPLGMCRDVELNILSPQDDSIHRLGTGGLSILFTIENDEDSAGIAQKVKLEAEDIGGLEFSSSEATIDVNKTAEIVLTIDGFIWDRETVTITVVGDNPDFDVDTDKIDLELVPPPLRLDIISPRSEIRLVDIKEGGDAQVTALVRNTGSHSLESVEMTISSRSGMGCEIRTGKKNIAINDLSEYKIDCKNISSGDRFDIEVRDRHNAAYDRESVRVFLVESFKYHDLVVLSPYENEGVRFGPYGGTIEILVNNTGDSILTNVCADLADVDFESSGCVDIEPGKTGEIMLNVMPKDNVTITKLFVNSSEDASDEVGVRILKLDIVDTEEGSDDPKEEDARDTQQSENGGPAGANKKGGSETESSNQGFSFEFTSEYLLVIVIIVVLILAGIIVKKRDRKY